MRLGVTDRAGDKAGSGTTVTGRLEKKKKQVQGPSWPMDEVQSWPSRLRALTGPDGVSADKLT